MLCKYIEIDKNYIKNIDDGYSLNGLYPVTDFDDLKHEYANKDLMSISDLYNNVKVAKIYGKIAFDEHNVGICPISIVSDEDNLQYSLVNIGGEKCIKLQNDSIAFIEDDGDEDPDTALIYVIQRY